MPVSRLTHVGAYFSVPFGGMMPGGLTGAGMGMGRLQGSLGGGTVLLVSNLEEEVRTGAVRGVLGSPVFAVPSESCLRFRPGSLPAAPSAAAHRQQSLKSIANTSREAPRSLRYSSYHF